MNENNKHQELPTDKTKEELLAANPEELNPTERYLQGLLKSYNELTLEEAIEFANSLP
jgi:hypothetical protein